MLDLDFTETLTAALTSSFMTAFEATNVAAIPCPKDQPAQLQRVCRCVARQLLFDLDGKMLLELALKKLSAEHQMKAAGLREPYPAFAASA